MYDVLFVQNKNGDGTKTLGKSDSSKETKKDADNCVAVRAFDG